jgi:hypothetical protein
MPTRQERIQTENEDMRRAALKLRVSCLLLRREDNNDEDS